MLDNVLEVWTDLMVSRPGAGVTRLRYWTTLLVAFAVSGLIVFASSHSTFENPASRPTTPKPIPTTSNSSHPSR